MKRIEHNAYLYATGRIRVLEGFLLNRERTIRLLETRTDDSAHRVLSECGYTTAPPKDLAALEAMLSEERLRVYTDMDKMLPDHRLVDVFRIPWDIHNAKTLLKATLGSVEVPQLLMDCGRIPPDRLLNIIRGMRLKELPAVLFRTVEEAHDLMARTGDLQLMDIALDKGCSKEMLSLSQEVGDRFFFDYLRLTIDASNLKTLVRGLLMEKSDPYLYQAMIPGGKVSVELFKHSSPQDAIASAFSKTPLETAASCGTSVLHGDSPQYSFERLCDNAAIAFIRSARSLAFGTPVAVAYLVAKEFELISLRLIFSGRFSGYGTEKILERIRDYYV